MTRLASSFLLPLLTQTVALAFSLPVVTVSAPTNGAQTTSPVHYVASASSPDCQQGIAAMRIYTAPGVGPYTVQGDHLDTNVSLAPGSYNTVVQAWDNCGGVGKTPVNLTITGSGGHTGSLPPPKFLYVTEHGTGKIDGYVVNPDTGSIVPTGQTPVWAHWGPMKVMSDKGGYRLYVVNEGSHDLNAYFIDRRNGYLYNVPGSPFAIAGTGSNLVVHPSGHFVYATTNSSHGGTESITALSVAADGSLRPLPGSPYIPPINPTSVVIDSAGSYLFVSAEHGVAAYSIEGGSGELTPVPGSPFPTIAPTNCTFCTSQPAEIAADPSGNYLYGVDDGNGYVMGYKIDRATGALSPLPGGPYADVPRGTLYPLDPGGGPQSLTVEPNGKFVYVANSESNDIAIFQINSDGSLKLQSRTPNTYGGICASGIVRVDPSGQFVYSLGSAGARCGPGSAILGFGINASDGSLTTVPSSPFPNNNVFPFQDWLAVTP